jgi:alpha-L-fucosidase
MVPASEGRSGEAMKSTRLATGLMAVLALALGAAACAPAAEEPPDAPPEPAFAADWESLSRHEAAPDWFRDAKLGIYFHWGVYSVPAYSTEWYPRLMHLPGHPVFEHHVATYGHPSEFGYHDFVPQFTAERFDPEEWAELFQNTGARFAGPVAEHHDGFSMWASTITPWNVGSRGPKRDITGELAASLRKRGMKLITTFHHARNLQRYHTPLKEDEFDGDFNVNSKSHYPLFEGMPPSSDDPELVLLYGKVPEAKWLPNVWLAKLKEVVDAYQPDLVWFDSWLDEIPEEYRKEFCAYYLNDAAARGKEVVILRKQDDLPLDFTVLDHEKSRMSGASDDVWMTDDTISRGSWCYTTDLEIKPAAEIIHALADTASKNGVVLLNVSPMADGTIPEDQRETLRGIGEWMAANGEAIYETRPWLTYGEGPTKEPSGGFQDHEEFLKLRYGPEDVRYTQGKDGKTVYAILLGSLDAGARVTLQAFAAAGEVAGVSLLSGESVEWSQGEDGLTIAAPAVRLDTPATVYRIRTK